MEQINKKTSWSYREAVHSPVKSQGTLIYLDSHTELLQLPITGRLLGGMTTVWNLVPLMGHLWFVVRWSVPERLVIYHNPKSDHKGILVCHPLLWDKAPRAGFDIILLPCSILSSTQIIQLRKNTIHLHPCSLSNRNLIHILHMPTQSTKGQSIVSDKSWLTI